MLIFLVILLLLPELSLGSALRNNGKYVPPPPVVFPGDEEDETQSSGSQNLRGAGGKPTSTETSSSSGYYHRKRGGTTSGVGSSAYLRTEPVKGGGVVFTPIGYLISPQGSHQSWLLWWLSESMGGPDTLNSILSTHLSRGAYYSACSSRRLEIKGNSITNYFFVAPVHNSLKNGNVSEDIKGFAFQPVFFGSYYVNGDRKTRKSVWSCDSIDSESISLNLEIAGYSVGSQNTYSYYFEAPLSCDLGSSDLVPLPFDFYSLKLREKGKVAVLIPHLSNLSVEVVGKLGSPIFLSSKENLNCQVGNANVRIFYTLRELAKASEREGLITRDAIKILDGPLGVPLKGEYSLEDLLEKSLKELESNPQYLEYATPQVLFSALIGPYCGNVDLRSYFLQERGVAFTSPLRNGYLDLCDMGYLPSDPSTYKRGKFFQGFYKFRMWTYIGSGDKRRPRLIALKAPLLQLPPEVISLKRGSIPARSSDVIDNTLRRLGKNRRLGEEVSPKPLYEPKNITPSLLFTLPENLAVRIIDLSLFNPSKTKSFIKLNLDANDPILSKITPDTKVEMTFDKRYITKLLNTYSSLDEAYPSPEWKRYDLILQRVKELGDRYEYKAVILNRWLSLKELASAIESGNLKLRTSDLLVHPLYAQLLQKHFPEASAEDYDLTFEFDPSSAYSGKTYEFNLENIFESGKGAEVGLEVPPGVYHVRIKGRDIDTRFKLVLPLYDVSDMKVYLTPSRSALLRWFFGQMLIPLLWALLILIMGILVLIILRRRKIILVDKPEKVLLIPFSKRYSLLDTSGGNLLERIKNFIASKLRLPKGQEVIARFGNYLILDKIATGGMGTVFKAIDSKTKEVVALKVIHPHLVENEEILDKFHREAEVLKVLHHPNIVRMIDAGVINGQPYIAYEFIDGKDLRTILEEKGKLPLSIAMKIFLQICEALDYAHQKGIIHRDIKPQNIMIMKDYFVKLTDFGIAKVIGESTGTTNEQVGTPLYASPEQLAGKPVDARSDIYSLGIVMFQVLTGHFPYDVADNVFSAIAAHIAQEPHRMKTLDKSALSQYVPYEVERIIMKMLEKDPDRRYQSVEELLIDLRNFLKRIKGA